MEVAVWRQGNLEVLLGGCEGVAQPGLGPTDASAATRRSGRTYRSRGPGRPLHAPLDGGLAAPEALPVVQQAQHPRALGHAGLERLAAVGCDLAPSRDVRVHSVRGAVCARRAAASTPASSPRAAHTNATGSAT